MPRILHTSDVHVGESRYGNADQGAGLLAMRAVVDLALRADVELVLFAGDLFDHNRVHLSVSDLVVHELARLPMPSVILPGNHDPLDVDSVYHRMDLPPGTRLVARPDGETFSFEDLDLEVWGRPHLSYSQDVEPLRGLPRALGARWQVAIAHGHLVRYPDDRFRSYRIHDEDIASAGRQYVALGHWDVHHDVSRGDVTACYSGSPNRKGVSVLVDLDGRGVRLQLVALPGVAG